jgi:hypothetical protein
MVRRTLVVGSRLALQEARFKAALAQDCGLQILAMPGLAARLAGGFLEMITRDALQDLVKEALGAGGFQAIGPIAGLPGMVRASTSTLSKVWDADLDLGRWIDRNPQVADIALIEKRVLSGLPAGMRLPRELVGEARKRISSAAAVLGPVSGENVYDVAPCWRQLILDLANVVHVEWYVAPTEADALSWLANSKVQLVLRAPLKPAIEAVSCANPKHEALEALRWARELLATGRVSPGEIAIAAATVDEWDDHIRALVNDSHLPVHFVHGCAALSTFPGQQAAALATVLLHGLSRDRVIRLMQLCRRSSQALEALPDDWKASLRDISPLVNLTQWQRALDESANNRKPGDADPRLILLPLIELLSRGESAAAEAGNKFLQGQALALWEQALRDGPPAALETTLEGLRVDDKEEPSVSIVWGPAHSLLTAPRKYVRLLGLTSRHWPRRAADDPLLPDYMIPARLLQPTPTPVQDRNRFRGILASTSAKLVLSRSRRDGEGRLLGASPLLPTGLGERSLRRVHIPPHAVSESDRLLARPFEFGATTLGKSSLACWNDWEKSKITAHDGMVAPCHSVVEHILGRPHSASSLKKLLTDPLGFLWSYAFRWEEPEEVVEPITLDRLNFGNLVHDILARAVRSLEAKGGVCRASSKSVEKAVTAAAEEAAAWWELEMPTPPRLVWRGTLENACQIALLALQVKEDPLPGQRTWVEVPFGRIWEELGGGNDPWDPAVPVTVAELGIQINGRIDRVDLDGDGKRARVTDYKTGRVPRNVEAQTIDGGSELQRSMYLLAVRSLLPKVKTIESRLLYPGSGNGIYPLPEADKTLKTLSAYLHLAMENARKGLTIPGEGSESEYNDLIFALPANAKGLYFARKAADRNRLHGKLVELWEIT